MPSTSARERAIQAYVKAFPNYKLYKNKLNVSKARTKKVINVSFGSAANKLSWSYEGGTLRRI